MTTIDYHGQPRHDGGDPIEISLKDSNGDDCDYQFTDNQNGMLLTYPISRLHSPFSSQFTLLFTLLCCRNRLLHYAWCQICQTVANDLISVSGLSDHVHCYCHSKNRCCQGHALLWLSSSGIFSIFVFVGSYAIRYMPRVLGAHQLSINIFDRPIKGSPFNLDVSGCIV